MRKNKIWAWTTFDEQMLRVMVEEGMTWKEIGEEMSRSIQAVRMRGKLLGLKAKYDVRVKKVVDRREYHRNYSRSYRAKKRLIDGDLEPVKRLKRVEYDEDGKKIRRPIKKTVVRELDKVKMEPSTYDLLKAGLKLIGKPSPRKKLDLTGQVADEKKFWEFMEGLKKAPVD